MLSKLKRSSLPVTALLTLLIFTFIIGCAKKEESPTKTESLLLKRGGIFRDSVLSSVTGFDPVKTIDVATLRLGQQIYQCLVEIDENLTIVPLLAESWETPDNKIWTFHIRKGVKFHDDPAFTGNKGREITAHDIKYSFERLLNPGAKTVGSWIFNDIVNGAKEYFDGKVKEVAGFKVIDDYTFRIELVKPFYPLLTRLSLYLCSIVPREGIEKYGEEYGQHPIGTGPFILTKLVPDQEIVLSKNTHYWEKDVDGNQLPYLDGVKIKFIREEMIQFKEFEAGNLDVSDIPTAMYPSIVDESRMLHGKYSGYQLKTAPAIEVQYYVFILAEKTFVTNKSLRQAFNYAIDKESIVRNVLKGRAIVAKGVIPHGLLAYNPDLKGYSYSIEAAKEKLKEAGYPDGQGLPEFKLVIDTGVLTEAVATAIQSQLLQVGVRAKIEITQFNTLLEMAAKGKASIFRLWFAASYPEPELFFIQFLSGYWPPLGFNFARYTNPKFDDVFSKATQAISESERIKYYREAEQIVVDDAPWIFLYHPEAAKILQPYMRNYQFNGLQLSKYKYIWIDK